MTGSFGYHLELLWTEIIKDSSSIMLGVFYRPPGSGYSPLSELHHSLLSIPDTQHIVLCGDFNLPGRQMDLLSDLLLDRSLTQLVTQPTRGKNILDLLLTNSPDMISQVDVVSGIPGSDHDAIQFLARFVKPTLVRQNRPVYNFRKADFDRFRDLLSKIPWNSCFLTDNVDDVWISFKDLLFTAADQCIPKLLLSRRKRVHWLSADTIRMIRREGSSKKPNGRASRMTSLGTREPLISSEVLPEGIIMTVS